MTALSALWLPILISAVVVFVLSSIIHMTPLWHKTDYPRYPQEDRVMDALRPLGMPPGDYFMPRPANTAEMRSPEFQEKMKRGPRVLMTIMPPWSGSMAKPLSLWFVYCLVVSVFAAFIAGSALHPGTPTFNAIAHYAGTTAFLGYTLALWQMSIWYQRAWSMTLKATFDGIIFALVTLAVFGWLWPR
jgi:nucleoside recognition membrane protein YjiH